MAGPNGVLDWQDTVPNGSEMPVIGWNPGIQSGVWVPVPSIFRLRLVGTGAAVISSRDRLFAETSVGSFSASGATNQIEFPYLGDAAVEMRAVFPATLQVEII